MDILSKYLSCKLEYITSSLCRSILLWTAKLPCPLKNNPKQQLPANNKGDLQVGLKTLVRSEDKLPPRIVHRYTLAATSKPPSPPPSSSLWSSSSTAFRSFVMDDLIGTESGDCLSSDVVDQELKAEPPTTQTQSKRSNSSSSRRARDRSARMRQYPPPITLLSQTGNVPGRMPWVFKREYSDGRLIIRAERVRRHEYIESHRENGRLTMRLVPADDDTVYCDDCGYPISEEDEVEELEDLEFNEEPEELAAEEEEEEEEEGGFDIEEELAKEGSNLSQKSSLENEAARCGDLRKCVTYAGGLVQDSDSFWNGNGVGSANGYLGRPGSAPLRPMTPVM